MLNKTQESEETRKEGSRAVSRTVTALVLSVVIFVGLGGLLLTYHYGILSPPDELTFTFTKTEELKIIGTVWGTNDANLTVSNNGASSFTISICRVNGNQKSFTTYSPFSSNALAKGSSGTVNIAYGSSWTSGTKYTFAIVTTTGNIYEYPGTAP
jgi:P pilus assembly chaperone PapD